MLKGADWAEGLFRELVLEVLSLSGSADGFGVADSRLLS